mmetsp:Transcript_44570/g.123968  ORF Transcript_44570/g.123968 Transcript_44570/m.123968 type:complete len:236 (-) Transcript_44570:429-1136(-)
MMAPRTVERPERKFKRVALPQCILPFVTITAKSEISCGASWSTVMPMSFHPKAGPQTLKATPITRPSEKLWKKSPKSTGNTTFQSAPWATSSSSSSVPRPTLFTRKWTPCFMSTQMNHEDMMDVPHAPEAAASVLPTATRCRPSGSSRNTAAAKMTPEAKELMAFTTKLPSAIVRSMGMKMRAMTTSESNVGSTVMKEPMITSPQRSNFTSFTSLQSSTDSSKTGSMSMPVAERK